MEISEEALKQATKLSKKELKYINKKTIELFEEMEENSFRFYTLLALCGSIGANVVNTTEGAVSLETVLEMVRLAISSQFPEK